MLVAHNVSYTSYILTLWFPHQSKLTHCILLVVAGRCSSGLASPGYSEGGRSLQLYSHLWPQSLAQNCFGVCILWLKMVARGCCILGYTLELGHIESKASEITQVDSYYTSQQTEREREREREQYMRQVINTLSPMCYILLMTECDWIGHQQLRLIY